MTRDLLDDFTDALEKEQRNYLIIVCDRNDSGRRIVTNMSELPERIHGITRRADLFQCISAAMDEDLEPNQAEEE